MEQFEYRNSNGARITIGYTLPYIIDSYSGLTATEIIPITNKGYNQNGMTFSSNTYGERVISISFYVYDDSMAGYYEKRRNIASIFNPLLGLGTLTYTNDYTSKKIDVVVSSAPEVSKRMGKLQLLTVELTAYNPLWKDIAEQAIKLNDYQGGLTFPFNNEEEPFIQFAQKGDIGYIVNSGDVSAPIRAEFRGSAENPIITLEETGEIIQVATTLAIGEKLIIETAYGNKNVKMIDTDGIETSAYNLISTDTTFFSLPVGTNTISFGSDGGQPEVFVYWYNWYVGV